MVSGALLPSIISAGDSRLLGHSLYRAGPSIFAGSRSVGRSTISLYVLSLEGWPVDLLADKIASSRKAQTKPVQAVS
jgi:hypothetical protein